MKQISVNQIAECLEEALGDGKKNILFVSATLEYDNARKWLENSDTYHIYRFATPQELWCSDNGILKRREGYFVIPDERLEALNTENRVLFEAPFGEKVVSGFEGFLTVLTDRYYINKFPDGTQEKHSLEKLRAFVAFTTPSGKDDFSLDEKYYSLFDAIYIVD